MVVFLQNRRQKTSSESSGRHEASSAAALTPTAAAAADSRATFPPEGVGGRALGGIASPDSGNNDDSVSVSYESLSQLLVYVQG